MGSTAFFDLDKGRTRELEVQRAPIVLDGMRVEHVRLETNSPYEFESVGAAHYIALHDLALRDGELRVEGLAPVRGTDLRDTLTYVPQGRAISGWAAPVERANSFTILQFDPATVSDALDERYRSAPPEPLLYARDPALLQSMTKLKRVARSEWPDRMYAEALALSVALEIFGVVQAPHRGRLSAQQMRRLTEFVDANLDGRLTLGDLAEVVGLSASHFSRTFTATFGRGPHQFTQERRIARAEELMRHTSKDLSEIASLSGFDSAASFRRNFKRITGRTPSSYRRND